MKWTPPPKEPLGILGWASLGAIALGVAYLLSVLVNG
jgi:hypothetical protein